MTASPIRSFLLLALLTAGVVGCQKEKPAASASAAGSPAASSAPAVVTAEKPGFFDDPVASAGPSADQQTALLKAVGLLAERQLAPALEALQAAQKLDDSTLLRNEIDRVRALLAQQEAAEATAADIEAVLLQGKAAEASLLAGQALRQYGGGDMADRFALLKRQADALLAVGGGADRVAQLRAEAAKAKDDNNLRAALLAYEQLAATGDAAAKAELEQVRTVLARHDAGRRRAAACRRDPQRLEEALEALKDAAAAWNTPAVQQDLADVQFALAARRDRLAIADFEVRGEVGSAFAGQAIADELLPLFKQRFDLVERGQLGAVLAELKLDPTALAENDLGRMEAGRLAQARYLIVGSVSPLAGLTVQARLLDARTGLIVQTAKLVAATPEEVRRRLPELARQLLMTDPEKLAWEQQQAARATPLPPAPATLPAFPEGTNSNPPLPLVASSFKPIGLGRLTFEDFERLPSQGLGLVPAPAPGTPLRTKMLALALEWGDDLFLRGRIAEADARYRTAFSLAPGLRDVQLRLDACRRLLPPNFASAPPRERIAVLNFLVVGQPGALPPGLSHWLPERLAPHFSPPLEVADAGEVAWFMNRLGLTVQDVMHNADARRWLGRALGVRHFLFGCVREAGGFTVNTYLVDAEFGGRAGEGQLFVRDPFELKLRLRELAHETLLSPADRLRQQQAAALREAALLEAQRAADAGQFTIALDLFGKLKLKHPLNVQITFLADQTQAKALQATLQFDRQREWERQQALLAAQAREQARLALAAEEARRQAAQAAFDRTRFQTQQQTASGQLRGQAQLALTAGNFTLCIQLLESAAALRPDEGLFRELAAARAKADEANRRRAAEESARREADRRRRQDAEAAAMQARLVEQEQRRLEAESARQALVRARDDEKRQRLLDEAQKLLAEGKHDAALAALATAQQLKRTPEADRLLTQVLLAQAQAKAKAQGAAQVAQLAKEQAAEQARREAADAEAKARQAKLEGLLAAAQAARDRGDFTQALVQYREAAKLRKSDELLGQIQQAEQALAMRKQEAEATKVQAAESARRAAALVRLKGAGAQFEREKKFDEALKLYREGLTLQPDEVELLAAQSRAEAARNQALAAARLQAGQEAQLADLVRLVRSSLAAKQFEAAEAYLLQLRKLKADHPAGPALVQEAQQARAAAVKAQAALAAKAQAETKAKIAAAAAREREFAKQEAAQEGQQLRRWLDRVQAAIKAEQFDIAQEALREAARLAPTDPAVGKLQRQLAEARATAAVAKAKQAEAAQAKADEADKSKGDKFKEHLQAGRAALADEDFGEAVAQFKAAVKLYPGDGDASLLLGVAEKRLQAEADQEAKEKAEAEAKRKMEEEEAKAKAAAEMKARQEAANKKTAADRLVAAGQQALAQKKHDEALEVFRQASALQPDDAKIKQLLEQAQRAKAAAAPPPTKPMYSGPAPSKPTPTLPAPTASAPLRDAAPSKPSAPSKPAAPTKPEEETPERRYTRSMRQGQQLEAAARFADAVAQYQAALLAKPKDPAATAALRLAEYGLFLNRGKQLLRAKKPDEAAESFRAALERKPKDPEATKLLEQAGKR